MTDPAPPRESAPAAPAAPEAPGLHRIVVVGGGAGGLELATRLGDRLGERRNGRFHRPGRARVTLIDAVLTHLWKPLLHEVAAGTLDSHDDDLEFLAQAHRHHFTFRLGRMRGLDRARREVLLDPILDANGAPIAPARRVPYDTLVIAIGSVSNDFGVPGVREHCRFLDTREQADAFQRALLGRYLKAQIAETPPTGDALRVAIVGGGATGVELAAELHHVARRLVAYGFDRIDPDRDVRLVLVEAADRLLPSAPGRVSALAREELTRLGIEVHTGTAVTRVTADGLQTAAGPIPAGVSVWAAGIKAPDCLSDLGLETDRLGRLVVGPTLQTPGDEAVFVLGDCAACPWSRAGRTLPPTAQVAHQQAMLLGRSLPLRVDAPGRPLPAFAYHDYGAMVSLSHYTAVGNLMGNLLGRLKGSVMIEGKLARLTYRLLYRKHQRAIYGTLRTVLLVVADALSRRGRARLKLH